MDPPPAVSVDAPTTSGRVGACSYCRSKKIRCSGPAGPAVGAGEMAPCEVCTKHGLDCSYPEHVSRKRKDRREAARAARAAASQAAQALDEQLPDVGSRPLDPILGSAGAGALSLDGMGHYPHVSFDPMMDFGIGAAHGPTPGAGPSSRSTSTQAYNGAYANPLVPDLDPETAAMFRWNFESQPALPMQATQDYVPEWNDLQSLEQLLAMDAFGDFSFLTGEGVADGFPAAVLPAPDLPASNWAGASKQPSVKALAGDLTSGLAETATVARSPSNEARFKVPYFRSVIAAMSAPASPNRRHVRLPGDTPGSTQEIMDVKGEYPSPEAVAHLVPLFHEHFTYAFPSVHMTLTADNYHDSAPHLVNIVCALAARFSPRYGPDPGVGVHGSPAVPVSKPGGTGGTGAGQGMDEAEAASAAHTWATCAKQQVSLQLAISRLDTVESLLLLSWYEFGQDRDSGLWMYSGMAFNSRARAQAEGLDKRDEGKPHTEASSEHANAPNDDLRRQYLAASLYMIDSILTMGTGRLGILQVPFDSNALSFPPIRGAAPGTTLPNPFTYLVRVYTLVSRMTRVLLFNPAVATLDATVAVSGVAAPDEVTKAHAERLAQIQSELNEFNTSLPPQLKFDTASFRAYAAVGQGGAFALLHLWFHSCIIFAFQPSITAVDMPTSRSLDAASASPNRLISASSAKTILDIVVFAELIDPKAITQPWAGYPIYTAGRTFLSHSVPDTDTDNAGHGADTADLTQSLALSLPLASSTSRSRSLNINAAGLLHMARMSRANFQKCIDVLAVPQLKWAGVRYMRVALRQKGRGRRRVDLGSGEGEGDGDGDADGDKTGGDMEDVSPLALGSEIAAGTGEWMQGPVPVPGSGAGQGSGKGSGVPDQDQVAEWLSGAVG